MSLLKRHAAIGLELAENLPGALHDAARQAGQLGHVHAIRAIGGACLAISQFTLAAELRHGNRPDFTAAAAPELAEPLYERVAAQLEARGVPVARGRFGASMQVESCNDGPVSLVLTVANGKVVARPQPG